MAGSMVECATSYSLIEPDQSMNLDICEICRSDSGQSKDVVKALKERIGHKDPKVQLLALAIPNARHTMEVLDKMLNVLDPGNREELSQEVIVEHMDQCHTYKQRVVQLVNSTMDEELLLHGLALHDDLQRVLTEHDAIEAGIGVPVEKMPKSLQALVETEDLSNQDSKSKEQGLVEPNQRTILPEPDITIDIEDSIDPFQYRIGEIRSWLAEHSDAEDVLDGEPPDKEIIKDFDELKRLGPHPFLERQMRKLPPLRWLHLKLQLKRDSDCWFRLILRADNLYLKGFTSRLNGGVQTCYEISEEQKEKRRAICNRPMLFPPEYNSVHLPWDLKYCQWLGCDSRDEATIFNMLQEMWDDPTFITRATEYFSFLDPDVCDPRVAKRFLAGIVFKLCEPVRMRLTRDMSFPILKVFVWGWTDICSELRKWKDGDYMCWNLIKNTGLKEAREALEVIILVLNRSHNSILYADSLRAIEVKKGTKPKDTPKKHAHRSDAAKKHEKASGSSTDKGDCSGGNVPFSRSRIQILGVRANFGINDINIYDGHRGQKIFMNESGYVCQENISLVLCGPGRPIGAFGYMGMEIFPTAPESEPILDYWDVSNCIDAEATLYEEVIYGRSHEKLFFSYLHIPNAIEAKIQVLLHCGESCEVSGFIKATATGYEGNCVEIFAKENEEKLSIPSSEWTTLPLLIDVLCLTYKRGVEIQLDVGLIVAQSGRRPHRLVRTPAFTNKYEQLEIKFDGNKRMQIIVSMYPDPTSSPADPVP